MSFETVFIVLFAGGVFWALVNIMDVDKPRVIVQRAYGSCPGPHYHELSPGIYDDGSGWTYAGDGWWERRVWTSPPKEKEKYMQVQPGVWALRESYVEVIDGK